MQELYLGFLIHSLLVRELPLFSCVGSPVYLHKWVFFAEAEEDEMTAQGPAVVE